MPHTRRARELGLCRISVGQLWDRQNDRFKLRLCWADQCIALCVGDDGMTEVRISLTQIKLADLGDGRIELQLVPGFTRKFFGHTAQHHNALREVYKDPLGGALDHERQAICHVRGGDPIKLATDFVVRVTVFRQEVNKPEPSIAALTAQKGHHQLSINIHTAPLGPKSTNSVVWNGQKNITAISPAKTCPPIANDNMSPFNMTKQMSRNTRDNALKFTPTNDKVWASNGKMPDNSFRAGENSRMQQRVDENHQPATSRFQPLGLSGKEVPRVQPQGTQYNPPPQFLQKANREALGPRPQIVPGKKFGSNVNPVPNRNPAPSPVMASLLDGSIPEPESKQDIPYPDHGPVMITPPKKKLERKEETIQNTIAHDPAIGMNSNLVFQTPIRNYGPANINTYPNTPNSFSSGESTSSPITSFSDGSVASRFHAPFCPSFKTQFGICPPMLGQNVSNSNGGVTLNSSMDFTTTDFPGMAVLIHSCRAHPNDVAVRPAPIWASLAELAILAAYFWVIPLEEVRLYGKFRGRRVILHDEKDWNGYIDVCTIEGTRCIVDVQREHMGGVNKCDPNIPPRWIWGPMPHTQSMSMPTSHLPTVSTVSGKASDLGCPISAGNNPFRALLGTFQTGPAMGGLNIIGHQ